ncbi:MAG: nucleotidyltransferase domain-containing protein [bacterium]|nr:nucleotidyltransferase domain-containing protein [bacterium]
MNNPAKKIQSKNELVAALRGYFAAQPDVIVVYLFGSQVTGRTQADSDVDVAVLLKEEDDFIRFERRLRLGNELEKIVGQPVDLIVLNDAPSLLVHQALKEGDLVFGRDREAQIEFEVRAGQMYADLKPMRRFFQQALFQEIKEVGLGGGQ